MHRKYLVAFVWMMLIASLACAQHQDEIDYNYWETDDIITSGGYTSVISIYGKVIRGDALLQVPYSEDQQISSPTLFLYKDGSYLVTKAEFTTTGIITEMFFTGMKCLQTELKSGMQFRLDYRVSSKNVLLYHLPSYIELFRYDSVRTNIQTTTGIQLQYRTLEYEGALCKQHIQFNDLSQNGGGSYTFTYHKDTALWKRIPENLIYQDEGIRFRFSPVIEATPLIDKYKNQPWSQIEQWIKPLLLKSGKMDGALKAFTDKLCGTLGPRESAEQIFLFVRNKINYFAIENGVWAFRPQPIAKTFSYRLGDCKAKALLLTQMLRYKGIPAWFCLASSINHQRNLDFPCAGNADHAICMTKIGAKQYYLDATMEHQAFDEIPESVAGKNIFAIALDKGPSEVLKVPELDPAHYVMNTNLELTVKHDTITGTVTVSQGKGITAILNTALDQIPAADAQEFWETALFEQTGRACNFEKIEIQSSDSLTVIKANVVVQSSKIILSGGKTFMMMDFFPFRFGYCEQIPEGFFYRNLSPLSYKLNVEIAFLDSLPSQKNREGRFDDGHFYMDYTSHIEGNKFSSTLLTVMPAGELSGIIRNSHNDFIESLNNTLHYAIQIY